MNEMAIKKIAQAFYKQTIEGEWYEMARAQDCRAVVLREMPETDKEKVINVTDDFLEVGFIKGFITAMELIGN